MKCASAAKLLTAAGRTVQPACPPGAAGTAARPPALRTASLLPTCTPKKALLHAYAAARAHSEPRRAPGAPCSLHLNPRRARRQRAVAGALPGGAGSPGRPGPGARCARRGAPRRRRARRCRGHGHSRGPWRPICGIGSAGRGGCAHSSFRWPRWRPRAGYRACMCTRAETRVTFKPRQVACAVS